MKNNNTSAVVTKSAITQRDGTTPIVGYNCIACGRATPPPPQSASAGYCQPCLKKGIRWKPQYSPTAIKDAVRIAEIRKQSPHEEHQTPRPRGTWVV